MSESIIVHLNWADALSCQLIHQSSSRPWLSRTYSAQGPDSVGDECIWWNSVYPLWHSDVHKWTTEDHWRVQMAMILHTTRSFRWFLCTESHTMWRLYGFFVDTWTTRWTNTSLTEWRANKWATVLIKCRLIPTSPWRHNEHDGVSNHQHHDCLLSRLFRRRSNKTSKPRIAGLCEGNSAVTVEFPTQRASNTENVSI